MKELTAEQRQAVDARGPVCLTASAGSGKTAVLVERYLSLLEQGLTPDRILTVTFTRKAGKQLRERIQARLPEDSALLSSIANTPWIGTLHSFCLQVLKNWGRLIGQETLFEILDPLQQADLVYQVRTQWMRSLEKPLLEKLYALWTPSDLEAIAEEALASPTAFSAQLRAPSSNEKVTLLQQAYLPLLDSWHAKLNQERVTTFDALEEGALRLLRDYPAARIHFQRLFRAVLVDEFQDTSPSQWVILQSLLGEDEKKLFVVGDPKQSIYRFRGADVSLFLHWSESIRDQGGDALCLRTCFRSSTALVNYINQTAQTLFKDSSLAQTPMLAGRTGDSPEPLALHYYGGETAQAAAEEERILIAAQVRALIDRGTAAPEIALLFRNSDRMELFATALSSLSIPVACEPIAPLFSLYEVQDLSSFLRAVVQPSEDYTLASFLRSPYGGFSPADMVALQAGAGTCLFEKLVFTGRLPWFIELVEKGVCETSLLLHTLFEKTHYWPRRSGALHALLGGLQDCTYSTDAVSRLSSWEKQGVKTSAPLLAHDPNGVRLMTVHGAKGLEFEEVFLVDMLRRTPNRLPWVHFDSDRGLGLRFRKGGETASDEVFDPVQERCIKEEREEANRILYVAATRAKDRLHLSLPKNKKLIPKGSWADSLAIEPEKIKGETWPSPEPHLRAALPVKHPDLPFLLGEDL